MLPTEMAPTHPDRRLPEGARSRVQWLSVLLLAAVGCDQGNANLFDAGSKLDSNVDAGSMPDCWRRERQLGGAIYRPAGLALPQTVCPELATRTRSRTACGRIGFPSTP
jgi:hypothetical protein